MMRVTIAIVPGGDESRARNIETLYVWNLSALAPVSDYAYSFEDPRPALSRGESLKHVADGFIVGHERSEGAWALTRKILTHAPLVPWGAR